jgi:hypothetical protein
VPQLAFLAAGQPQHLARLVVLALDEREGLQYRVVQVRGDLGAFGLDDALAALLPQLADQPQPPRHGEHGDPDQRGQHGEQRELGLPELDVAQQVDRDPGGHEDHPGQQSQHGAAPADPGTAGPALALRLVGLPPDHRSADRGHPERADHPTDHGVVQGGGGQPDPDGQREQPQGLLALGPGDGPRHVGLLLPHEDPQQPVAEHPATTEHGEHHERGAHPQHRHLEVVGDPAGDARDEPPAAPADQWRGSGGERRGLRRRDRTRCTHVIHRHTSCAGEHRGNLGAVSGPSLM